MADEAMANAMNYVMGSRQAANANVIDALDQDPEKAAESINLGKATGVDPVLINTDVDYFKRQNKVRATSALIDSNEYIREFMLRNPMAPKVAHDDVGNLDNLTMNVAKEYLPALAHPLYANLKIGNKLWQLATGSPPPWQRGYVSTMLEQNPELVGQFLKGASYGTPELIRQPMLAGSKALIDFSKLSPEEYKMQQKSLWEVGGPFDAITWFLEQAGSAVGSAIMPATAGGIGMVAGIPGGPGGMAAGGFLGATSMSYIMNYGEVHKALEQAGVDEATAQKFATMAAAPMAALDVTGLGFVANRFMSAAAKKQAIDTIIAKAKVWGKEVGLAGAVEGGTEGIQEVIKDAFVSAGSDTAFMTKEHAKGWVESALAGFAGGTVFGAASAVVGTHQKARPYIDAGKDPPAGLDPTLDQIKGGQAVQDVKRIEGLRQDAKATNLRDRSPEMVSDLLKRQVGDTVMEIPSAQVYKLYGDGTKPITPDDGLLGWVTDLQQQMDATYPQGGFVSVPMRDWLAHSTDEVADALHDHLLPRPSGLTIDEAKSQGKSQFAFDVYHGTPHFFDVFDLQYMGTGEGAQVRGAGMYFGQAEQTGKHYAIEREYRGKTMGEVRALEALRLNPSSREGAMAALDADSKRFEKGSAIYREIRNAVNLIKKGWQPPAPTTPQLLKTRIHAELEQFMDLDKPLSEQSSGVQAILRELGMTEGPISLGEFAGQKVEGAPETAEGFLKRLETKLGGRIEAAEALAEAGIPGSKFLDQFSRGKDQTLVAKVEETLAQVEDTLSKYPDPEGKLAQRRDDLKAQLEQFRPTYNIVLFDTALAQIIERNGQVIASTRQAASLGVMIDLGPQAEYMLFQNRLRMQAIMDKLNQAKTPEEVASLRQEVKEVEQLLRTLGKEATGRLTAGGWDIVPGGRPVTIAIGDNEMDVIPTGTSSIKEVLSGIDFSYLGPTSKYLQPIIDRVNELASDIPVYVVSDRDFAELEAAAGVTDTAGVFTTFEGRDKEEGKTDHIIIPESSFHSPHAAKYVFHEAIHAATSRALYDTPALVSIIDDLIISLKESNPELVEAYGFKNAHEFVAEAISNKEFQDALASIKMTEGWAKALGMKEWQEKSLWQGIVEFIRSALSVPKESFTVLEGALRLAEFATEVQAGVLARQEGVGRSLAVKKQLELPGITRQEDLAIFEEAKTVGLTIDQYIKMMENIAQRNTADTAFLMKQAEKFVRKRLTQEWKQEELKKKIDVADQMNSRPDIALMNFFRTGRIYGEQVGMPKIDGSQLTPEQRKLIPDRWLGARGMAPMDAAQLVGYTSVDQMALRVALLNEQMIAAKQPSLRKYVDGLVKAEVERQMVKEFGGLEENILKEVQEHVVSPTQMDLLHEDTVAMGMANGWTMPFTKAEVIAGVKAGFGKLNAMKVSMEKFLRDSGRAGKLSGIAAEIEKDSTEFFKQRQKQEYSMRYAGEAKKLEKELTSFDNTAGKLSRREARTVDQTYFNYAQDMLEKAGLPVKNSRAEIDRSIAFKGHANMDAFITHEKGKGVDLDLYIPENYEPKQFETMTVDEFREFKEVVDTLEMAGRIRRKIHLEGEQRDADAYEAEVIDHVTQMPLRPETPRGRWMYRLDAVWTRMEEIVKDLDLREELGPLWRGLIYPFELSKSKKFSMIEDLSKKMKTLMGGDKAWQRTLEDEIPQDFVYDTRNGVFFKLTRWNLIKMMMNVGNESNKAKLARGIASAYVGRVANGQETEIVMNRIDALIDRHANKEDWQFVQNIWDIFQGFAEESDTVIRNTMGKIPKWIEAMPIANRHGNFAGGYIPLIKDKLRLIEGQVERPDVDVDALMGPDFYRAATSRPHHLERTGAVYFVDITNGIENLAGRMQQHIHDIAFRDFVLNAGKIIYNKKIMSAIEKHYGIEYANQMEPWLKRIANEFTVPERELGVINDMLRFFRLSLTAAALPLNYAVMYSPSVGTMNVRQILALGAETQAERKRILANSEELKHVLYTIDRDLTEQLQHVVGGRGAWAKWTSFQRRAVETMYKPLVAMEQETRAVTFYGEFMAQKANGLSDGEAASLADSVVRERHGAVSQGDLPAMMASNSEFVKVATVFMGYFSMVRNWTRQLPGQYRRGEYAEMAKTVWGTMLVAALFNAALFTRRKEDDTIWSFLARALLDTPMSMVPFVREGWGHFTEGRRPTSPIFGMYMATQNLIKDGVNALQGKEVKHPIRHTLNFMGLAAGVPGTVQLGRTAEGLVDVARDRQRPRDFNEWMRLLHTGEAKLRK